MSTCANTARTQPRRPCARRRISIFYFYNSYPFLLFIIYYIIKNKQMSRGLIPLDICYLLRAIFQDIPSSFNSSPLVCELIALFFLLHRVKGRGCPNLSSFLLRFSLFIHYGVSYRRNSAMVEVTWHARLPACSSQLWQFLALSSTSTPRLVTIYFFLLLERAKMMRSAGISGR